MRFDWLMLRSWNSILENCLYTEFLIYNLKLLGSMLLNIYQSSIQMVSVRLLRFADVVGQDAGISLWSWESNLLQKLSAGPSMQSEAQSRVGKDQWQNWVEDDQRSGADSGNSVWNQLST